VRPSWAFPLISVDAIKRFSLVAWPDFDALGPDFRRSPAFLTAESRRHSGCIGGLLHGRPRRRPFKRAIANRPRTCILIRVISLTRANNRWSLLHVDLTITNQKRDRFAEAAARRSEAAAKILAIQSKALAQLPSGRRLPIINEKSASLRSQLRRRAMERRNSAKPIQSRRCRPA